MNLSAPPIQRSKSLHQQTYEALRSSILSGQLAPGDRLVETQLAQQLQVSRTPIREAIRQLQREGLVKADGGGLRVTAISALDAMQLYDCRLALEALSVVEACQHATQEQIDRLAHYVTEAEDLLTLKNTRSLNLDAHTDRSTQPPLADRLLDLDYHFHRLIAEGANNSWLVFLLDQVFDKMALLRIETTRHDPGVLEVRLEHRRIYQAIAKRDRTAAAEAIQGHLTASKVRVIQSIEDLHSETPP